MRKALNEDPRAQIVVFVLVGIVAVFFLFTTVMKKDPATDPAAVDPATVAATPTATGTDGATDGSASATAPADSGTPAAPTTPATPSTPVTPATPNAGTDPGAASGLLPSKGLPKDVLVAYAKNKAIALLVIDPKGLSDKQLKGFTEPLRSRKDVTLFVVKSKNIGDYYRITTGVSVDRVPALVVIRPRKLNKGEPTAMVSYGFRGPRSVDQAVDDALYDGKAVPSYP